MNIKHILTAGSAMAFCATTAMADFELTILHTNDFHARFEPISRFDSGCSDEDNAAGECFGGTARLVTAIAEARARNDNTILVDAGDQFQGSLFYTYYKGAMAAEFMNKIGYDAMAVGNHEFDDGPEVLRGFVDTVSFPVLMSNADISMEPELSGALKRSTLLEVDGEIIGIIGVTTTDTPDLASPGDNVIFTDPADSVQHQVDLLTDMGVNKIIVLSHTGYNMDRYIAEATTGVDVIVGGHTNTYLSNLDEDAAGKYPTMIGDTAVVQAYAFGKFLGELNVYFDDDGKVLSAFGEPLIMDAAITEDSETVARIDELAVPLDEVRNEVVANTSEAIDGDRANCRAMECQMGNLVADAMLERVAGQGITIAIANGGGLRSSIDAGEVTMGEILTVLPFQNTLATFEISGAGIVEALENGVSQIEEGAGRFAQVAGLQYSFDATADAGSRVSDVMVADGDSWVAIDTEATYGVVTNNYVRGGGDGYSVFATEAMNVYDYGPALDEVVADYMSANGDYTPYLDGRITVK